VAALAAAGGVGGAAAAATGEQLEEVVIVAQKREQSVQDVPIAVTAVSGDTLKDLGINTSKDIAMVVPNVQWSASDAGQVPNIYVRGVGDSSFQSNQVGSVGMYSDEVSLNSPILWNFGMFDLQRVEVLRGPQNTLFGRNTTGGAILFESRRPRVGDPVSGYVAATAGNFGRFDAEAGLALPLGEQFAARLAIARFGQGDFLNNVNLHKQEGANQRTAGRLQLLWQPSEAFSGLLNLHGGVFRGDSVRYKAIGLSDPNNPGYSDCPYALSNPNPGNGCADQTGYIDSSDFTKVADNSENMFDANMRGGFLRLDWKVAAMNITSLTGYEHADSKKADDSGVSPSFIFTYHQGTDSDQFTEELRATSADSAKVKWIAGLYYFDEDLATTTAVRRGNPILTNSTTPGLPVPEAGVTSFIPFTMLDQKDTAWSAYGQAEIPFAEQFSLTAGLRYTREEKKGTLTPGATADTTPLYGPAAFIGPAELHQLLTGATQVGPGPLPFNCPPPFPLTNCYERLPFDQTSNIVGGKVSFNYKPNQDVLLYASAARGFKAGNISTAALDAIVGRGGSVVNPEFLWTYEVGVKSEWLEHRLRINAAAFHNSWTDEQLFLVEPTALGLNPVLTNVPKTESQGIDLDLTALPARGLTLTVGGGWLHSSAKDIGSIPGAVRGSPLIGAPTFTLTTVVRQEWELGNGTLGISANAHYTTEQHWDLSESPLLTEPGYWLVNASADYQFGPKHRYQVSLAGKNLSGTQYCFFRSSQAGTGFGDVIACYPNDARRFVMASIRVNLD
jgi:iron complex outermembrane receptor protein